MRLKPLLALLSTHQDLIFKFVVIILLAMCFGRINDAASCLYVLVANSYGRQ